MKLRYLVPLIVFVVPTVVIGYGFMIPNSPIAGLNGLTVGFGTTLLGACLTYLTGIQMVMKDPPST